MIFSPGASKAIGNAVFCSAMAGARVARMAAVSPSVTGGPTGGSPVTVAALVICPASTSAWVVR